MLSNRLGEPYDFEPDSPGNPCFRTGDVPQDLRYWARPQFPESHSIPASSESKTGSAGRRIYARPGPHGSHSPTSCGVPQAASVQGCSWTVSSARPARRVSTDTWVTRSSASPSRMAVSRVTVMRLTKIDGLLTR